MSDENVIDFSKYKKKESDNIKPKEKLSERLRKTISPELVKQMRQQKRNEHGFQ